MRDRFFALLARVVTRRPGWTLAACGLLTLAMLAATGRLGMKTQFADMMPKGIPQIQEFQEILDNYQSASSIMIIVESEKKDVGRMKQVAEDIVSKLSSVKRIKPAEGVEIPFVQQVGTWFGKLPEGVPLDTIELVKRIDYKLDNDFVSKHGMMIQKTGNLENMLDMFGSLSLPDLIENINDNFEKEYIEDSDNLASLDGEAEAVQGLESMYKFVESIGAYTATGDTSRVAEAVEAFVTGPQYFISPDNTLLLIMLQPTVDMEDFEDGMYLGYQVYDTIKAMNERLDDIEVGGTGWMLIQIDETEASKKDFGWPSLVALGLILLLLIGSFRTWKNPFYAVVTLTVAILWTAGFLALVLHYLNMMSVVFVIMLVGLGIDFGIHIVSGFKDGSDRGLDPERAMEYAFDRSGPGIVTGAMTTAIVFFALMLTDFRALSEMGIAIGSGIVITMLAALVLLPALIMWDNKGYSAIGSLLRKIGLGFFVTAWGALVNALYWFFRLRIFTWLTGLLQFGYLETAGRWLTRLPVAIVVLVLSLGSMVASYIAGTGIGFEYDMMELEPVGIPTVIAQDKILEKFEIAPDYAMVRASDVDDCRDKIEKLKKVGNRTGVIGSVDGITEFLPGEQQQRENQPLIGEFADRLAAMRPTDSFTAADVARLERELIRLHQNIAEIGELSVMGSGEGNKIIRKCDHIVGKTDEDSRILELANTVAGLASTPRVLGPFQKTMGKVLKSRLSDMSSTDIVTMESLPNEIRERYVSPVSGDLLITVYPKANVWEERNLRKFHAETQKVSPRVTGTPVIMLLFIDLMKEKGRVAIILGAIAIVAFLLLDFRSVKYTIFAAIPLVIGALWMVGAMAALGMKFNIINFMCLPLILGIGIDDGVHVLHRYRKEGRLSFPAVLRYTGKAILLTSLTTMIGFGSMGLASHRGTASMGQVLFIGVGACFLSSAFVLPAIVTIWENLFNRDKRGVAK